MVSNNLSYLGLARRAGKVVAGTAACEKAIKKGTLKLLLLSGELSAQSNAKFVHMCEKFGIDVLTLNKYDRLGFSIGKPGIMIAGITDSGFAEAIKKNIIDGGKRE